MSILFAETVRKMTASLIGESWLQIDSVERVAVMSSICELAFVRLYHEFDFPENWPNDPNAYELFAQLQIHLLIEMSPNPTQLREKLPGIFDAALERFRNPPPPVEPKTNRGREFQRRTEVRYRSAFREAREYNPKRWGKVRKYTQEELHSFLDKAGARAARAFQQWRLGVPLEQIDG
jgi:hypothetical protein